MAHFMLCVFYPTKHKENNNAAISDSKGSDWPTQVRDTERALTSQTGPAHFLQGPHHGPHIPDVQRDLMGKTMFFHKNNYFSMTLK